MKNIIALIFKTIINITIILSSIIAGFFGTTYFLLVEPTTNWIKFINDIPKENLWVFALSFLILGYFGWMIVILNIIKQCINYSKKDLTKKHKILL